MSSPKNDPDKAAKVFADDRANVFHSWSAQAQISPMAIAGGAGSYFWDFTGKKYLDFSCQLVFTNIGHQHPKVIEGTGWCREPKSTVQNSCRFDSERSYPFVRGNY